MKVEQYKRQAVPGVREVPYHVKPMDLSEGLRIGAAGTEALGKGIANLGKSIEGIADLQKKVQAEKDELFGNATFHEFEAEMQAFQPTLDMEKDDEALNLIYKKYGDRITDETSISDESRKRLLQALDNRFEVGRIRAGGTRNRMAVQANINQTQKYFEEARDAGNTDKALILAEELRRKGVGMPSNEAITSICRKNGYETNIANLTYGSLDDLESDIGKALLNDGGFDGMSEKDSILIREQIRKQKRLIEEEDRDRFLADMTDGNVPALDALEAEHRNGVVSDGQYVWKSNTVKTWLEKQKRERLHGESQAEKARQKAVKEAKAELLLRIGLADFTGTGQENEALTKGFWDEARRKFNTDFVTLNEINNSLKSASKEGNVFSTPEGKLCREVLSKAYKDGKLYYDPWGLFNKEDGAEFQAARYLELHNWMKEELKKKTPVDEIIKGVNDRVADLNAGKVKSFLAANMGTAAPKVNAVPADNASKIDASPNPGSKGRVFGEGTTGIWRGKKVVVKNGKWELLPNPETAKRIPNPDEPKQKTEQSPYGGALWKSVLFPEK